MVYLPRLPSFRGNTSTDSTICTILYTHQYKIHTIATRLLSLNTCSACIVWYAKRGGNSAMNIRHTMQLLQHDAC